VSHAVSTVEVVSTNWGAFCMSGHCDGRESCLYRPSLLSERSSERITTCLPIDIVLGTAKCQRKKVSGGCWLWPTKPHWLSGSADISIVCFITSDISSVCPITLSGMTQQWLVWRTLWRYSLRILTDIFVDSVQFLWGWDMPSCMLPAATLKIWIVDWLVN
jgi:hypothetical protein